MHIISVYVLCMSLGAIFGSDCKNIYGLWRNQLGSNMSVIHTSEDQITGEYSTAVESKLRAALVSSNITGTFMPVGDGALLSFTVLFNHGKSLTTWVGQCMVCDGEEVLFTTWALRSLASKPVDKWLTVNVNQDTFMRVKETSTNIPFHMKVGPSTRDKRSISCEKNMNAGLQGHWMSENNQSLTFSECYESGTFLGSNNGENMVTGRSNMGGSFTAIGLVSASSSESIEGWTGHIYENPKQRRTMETVRLSHTFSKSCKNPRSQVRLGVENYVFSYQNKNPCASNTCQNGEVCKIKGSSYECRHEQNVVSKSGWQKFVDYMRSMF